MERFVPLFEDMKDFVRATARGTETVLRQEMQDMRTELKNDIHALDAKVQALDSKVLVMDKKIDIIQCAITEHSKTILKIETAVEDHENRLTHVEHSTA